MNNIIVKYIEKGKPREEHISTAACWNDLTIPQLLYIGDLWQAWQMIAREGLSLIKAKSLLFIELMNDKGAIAKARRIHILKKIDKENLYSLIELSNFVFEGNALTKNPFPVVTIAGKKYFGPSDRLSNLTAFEWSFADGFYMHYTKNADEDKLDVLIGALYRPGADPDDPSSRLPFDHKAIEKYIVDLKTLSYSQKQVILLWYIGCRTHIVKNNPAVFNGSSESSAVSTSWIDVILALSGGKFGTFNETGAMDLSLVFKEIKNLAEAAEKRKKK